MEQNQWMIEMLQPILISWLVGVIILVFMKLLFGRGSNQAIVACLVSSVFFPVGVRVGCGIAIVPGVFSMELLTETGRTISSIGSNLTLLLPQAIVFSIITFFWFASNGPDDIENDEITQKSKPPDIETR